MFDNIQICIEWFILAFKQPIMRIHNTFNASFIPCVMENMFVVLPLILCFLSNTKPWHLSQLGKNIPSHITFHPCIRIISLCPNVVCFTLKCQVINAIAHICNPSYKKYFISTFHKGLEKYKHIKLENNKGIQKQLM
jgi:hypothetical protein